MLNKINNYREQKVLVSQLEAGLKDAKEYLSLLREELPTIEDAMKMADNGELGTFSQAIAIINDLKSLSTAIKLKGESLGRTTTDDFLTKYPDGIKRFYKDVEYSLKAVDGKFILDGGQFNNQATSSITNAGDVVRGSTGQSGMVFWKI
jgi:hypothetical protein